MVETKMRLGREDHLEDYKKKINEDKF